MKRLSKRLCSLVLALALVFGMVSFAALASDVVASGSCGHNLTWTLDAAGTLTVRGTGDMEGSPVWATDHRLDIKKAILEKGVASIGAHAFSDCAGLTEIKIPDSVKSIGRYAFYMCISLKSVSIPDSVTWIGDYTFLGCRSLVELKLPAGITVISDFTFDDCPMLTDLKIPAGVTDIGDAAFYDCDGLTGVALPDGVRVLWINAFSSCDGLRQILIPKSVSEIKMYAFSKCERLSDVYYTGTEAEWKNILIHTSNTELLSAKIHFEWKGGLPELLLSGDVSGDGSVTAEDARLALRAAVGLETYAPGSTEFLAADATKDGEITSEDARLILRAAVGLETLA